MLLLKERELIQEYGKMLITRGLTTGSGGNLSLFNREKGLKLTFDYFCSLTKEQLHKKEHQSFNEFNKF